MPHLYHYCSSAAFHGIIDSKALWLSSLRQSNDIAEGRMVAHAARRLAEKDGLTPELIEHILAAIANMENLSEGLGVCLSENGDLLSQWRAYAADGSGVSIGFDRQYLNWLVESSRGTDTDLELHQIEYEFQAHDHLVMPTYLELRRLLESDADFLPGATPAARDSDDPKIVELRGRRAVLTLLRAAMDAFNGVFSLKHPAFTEEQEWRLLHHHGLLPTHPCLFRAVNGGIVPYKTCLLRDSGQSSIAELVLGPRHTTPVPVVEGYLAQQGFQNVKVRPSVAPYR
jgi:Protein of unknown function (DUF2971)